jgi:hypothetical protein
MIITTEFEDKGHGMNMLKQDHGRKKQENKSVFEPELRSRDQCIFLSENINRNQ